ncbi:MAG: metallo-beta-lactamase family protein [Acidobacteriaceae bacterium]|nr:metallo-beta-lactamase family protein [Acidobacteriaceae bacterium]
MVVTKLKQFVKLVRESHENPMTGVPRDLDLAGEGEIGVTFIGHSSFLLQIGGRNVLVDPVFAKRLVVLRRQRVPGLKLEGMPAIDMILITHAHMDHLNLPTLRRVVRRTKKLRGVAPVVVVPRGVEDLVDKIGFSAVHAMEWWEQKVVLGLQVTMTPCKHWGARMFRDTHRGFGGYCVSDGVQSIYHSGDTAYFDGFKEVGRQLKPDVALLPIGAYFPDTYRSVHTSPEEAVRGFVETGAEWMIPMHFGTFRLGREPMDEPVQRLEAEALRLGISEKIRVLEEGETMRIEGRSMFAELARVELEGMRP